MSERDASLALTSSCCGAIQTYTVTQAPQHGTLTIDQVTGNFTYTPDDINYDAAQTDSFAVSVTDGKFKAERAEVGISMRSCGAP